MLKEQDDLIELIREWIIHPAETIPLSVQEVFQVVEQMIVEQTSNPDCTTNRLLKYLPSPPKFFLPLGLVEALQEYHERTHLLSRRFVPPTFKEVRHILNISVVRAINVVIFASFQRFIGQRDRSKASTRYFRCRRYDL